METVVYLIRHSEVTHKNNIKNVNYNDSLQARLEKAFLSVSGEKRAESLSKVEELQNIDAVYSSGYVSCLETAKYIALENNTIVNVDDRFNERKIGSIGEMECSEFCHLQAKDLNFKLSGGESLNQTKKRAVEAMKNVLMFETGNRVAIVTHSKLLTCLLSAWCETGYNYNEDIILTYNGDTIIDGSFSAPMVFKVVFDGMNVVSVEYLDLLK